MERPAGEGSNLGNIVRNMCKAHNALLLAMEAQKLKAAGFKSKDIAAKLNRKPRQVFHMFNVNYGVKMREIINMLKPYPHYKLPINIENRLGITPEVENGRVTYSIAENLLH